MVLPDRYRYTTSPQALLQLMKDLERSGFHPAFTFDEGQLTMFIHRKPINKKFSQNDPHLRRFY